MEGSPDWPGIIISILALSLLVIQPAVGISGNIVKVEWPENEIRISGTLTPWVYVANTGNEDASYNIQLTIQHGDASYTGACWPTDTIGVGETKVEWPWGVQVTPSMPSGSYDAKVTLFEGYCGRNTLDEVTILDAFVVS